MSVNAALCVAFKPNPLFLSLRDGNTKSDHPSHVNGSVLRDIDDEMMEHVRELRLNNAKLQSDMDEMTKVFELMHQHMQMMEETHQSMLLYTNKLYNDVKTVRRRSVWKKFEYDRERQVLVEELYMWKRKAMEAKANEVEALEAAEATAAHAEVEITNLNKTIERLQSQLRHVNEEFCVTKQSISHYKSLLKEDAIESLKELVIELQTHAEDSAIDLEQHKTRTEQEISDLCDRVAELKQKLVIQKYEHDRVRQELVEEVVMWKNIAHSGGKDQSENFNNDIVDDHDDDDDEQDQDDHNGTAEFAIEGPKGTADEQCKRETKTTRLKRNVSSLPHGNQDDDDIALCLQVQRS